MRALIFSFLPALLCAAPVAAAGAPPVTCVFERVCAMVSTGGECGPNDRGVKATFQRPDAAAARLSLHADHSRELYAASGRVTEEDGLTFFHGVRREGRKPTSLSLVIGLKGDATVAVLAEGVALTWGGTCAAPQKGGM